MKVEFTLPIHPMQKERARADVYRKFHTPQRSRDFEQSVKFLASKYRPRVLLDGPLKLTVRFFLIPPKRRKFSEPAVKPDLDNFTKALKDALNGVIWTDDARVCQYGEGTGKYYDLAGGLGHIEVIVEEI